MNVTIAWLTLFVVLVAIEFATLGLTTIWFAAGALAATIAAAFDAPLFIQITLFVFISVVLLFFTRPIAVKYFNKDRVRTNAESLIGRQAIVISEIDNLQGIGQATVGGQEWSARSNVESVKIPLGAVVTIQEISGVKLIVEETKDKQ
ncbi:MAG: NfeD family protein [Lachnospiraceae bacterium]|nr:NfeD family protein [Lachnospiraceae bacterium]